MRMNVGAEIIWLRLLLQILGEDAAIERATAQQHSAEVMGFDVWMRERADAAHAAFMDRTAKHLPCDWRTFPPDEITRYFRGYADRALT